MTEGYVATHVPAWGWCWSEQVDLLDLVAWDYNYTWAIFTRAERVAHGLLAGLFGFLFCGSFSPLNSVNGRAICGNVCGWIGYLCGGLLGVGIAIKDILSGTLASENESVFRTLSLPKSLVCLVMSY